MTGSKQKFQPSRILYEVVVGTFKANGTPFETWCRNNKITPNNARSALMGLNVGPSGKRLLNKLVDGAGREVVTVAYCARMERHLEDISEDNAA